LRRVTTGNPILLGYSEGAMSLLSVQGIVPMLEYGTIGGLPIGRQPGR